MATHFHKISMSIRDLFTKVYVLPLRLLSCNPNPFISLLLIIDPTYSFKLAIHELVHYNHHYSTLPMFKCFPIFIMTFFRLWLCSQHNMLIFILRTQWFYFFLGEWFQELNLLLPYIHHHCVRFWGKSKILHTIVFSNFKIFSSL